MKTESSETQIKQQCSSARLAIILPTWLVFSFSVVSLSLFCSSSAVGQQTAAEESPADSPAQPVVLSDNNFPDLTIPAGADASTLAKIVQAAKTARPGSVEQYKLQQTTIRDASAELLKKLKQGEADYAQAEMDTIISSVALLTFFTEDEQTDIVQQVKDFLTKRKTLAIQDIQTGMMAAGMLELQPYKEPSREIYQLLDDLLKEDAREEMQSLRFNLQASVRRLGLLGNKFELDAKTIDGRRIQTDDLAGKFVIVDFFATWCEPCAAESARILAHYEKYATRGLEVIGICLDEDLAVLKKHLNESPLPWPIVHDAAENELDRLAVKFGVSALPTVMLLNKEGTVVSLEARDSELNRLMQMLFETPTPAAELPKEGDGPGEVEESEKTQKSDNVSTDSDQ